MSHFTLLLLLPLFFANHRIPVIVVILVCGNYRRLSWRYVHGSTQFFITNHTEKIQAKLRPHDEIIIRGTLLQRIFYIDLAANLTHIPFHLKATDSAIYFNSKLNNLWQNEIRLVSTRLPLNTTFIVDIVVDTDEGFNVSLNEQIFVQTPKRLPLDPIKELRILGNFTLQSVKITQPRAKEESSQRNLIIGVAIGGVVVIIGVMGIFYVLRRQCVNRTATKATPSEAQDRTVDSLGSYRTGGTALSQKTSQTGNSFVP